MKSNILFPHTRSQADRVSEQEARCIFLTQIAKANLLYSIETPTEKTYKFTGEGKISASTDLTVYSRQAEKLVNVEFKSKGFSPGRKDTSMISKDMEKLIREPVDGFWFHILDGVNNNTLPNLWSLFCAEYWEALKSSLQKDAIKKKSITFHFCVLKHGFSIQTEVLFDPENITAEPYPDYPVPEHEVSFVLLKTISESPYWKFYPR
jgi:hypothetical protein